MKKISLLLFAILLCTVRVEASFENENKGRAKTDSATSMRMNSTNARITARKNRRSGAASKSKGSNTSSTAAVTPAPAPLQVNVGSNTKERATAAPVTSTTVSDSHPEADSPAAINPLPTEQQETASAAASAEDQPPSPPAAPVTSSTVSALHADHLDSTPIDQSQERASTPPVENAHLSAGDEHKEDLVTPTPVPQQEQLSPTADPHHLNQRAADSDKHTPQEVPLSEIAQQAYNEKATKGDYLSLSAQNCEALAEKQPDPHISAYYKKASTLLSTPSANATQHQYLFDAAYSCYCAAKERSTIPESERDQAPSDSDSPDTKRKKKVVTFFTASANCYEQAVWESESNNPSASSTCELGHLYFLGARELEQGTQENDLYYDTLIRARELGSNISSMPAARTQSAERRTTPESEGIQPSRVTLEAVHKEPIQRGVPLTKENAQLGQTKQTAVPAPRPSPSRLESTQTPALTWRQALEECNIGCTIQ